MLKVGQCSDGNPMIVLGLSAKDVELLKDGKRMLVKLSELGLEGQIAIVYGETEKAIQPYVVCRVQKASVLDPEWHLLQERPRGSGFPAG